MLKAGVMGWPVSHSLSPRLHGYWLKELNLKGEYLALPVRPEDLYAAILSLPEKGFAGVNLTIPIRKRPWRFSIRTAASMTSLKELARSIPLP